MRNQNIVVVISLGLTCFALLSEVQAVSPAPDGCYPNFTAAEGCDALDSLTTGAGNTAFGWRSLFLNTDGSFNTGVGGGALALNNGASNTAVGAAALLLNTTGTQNTAVGTDAMVLNDSGSANTATGVEALFSNSTGEGNTADGAYALDSNTTGNVNTAIGDQALFSNTTGNNNIATVLARLNLTWTAITTRPSVFRRYLTIPPPATTRRSGMSHCSATLPESSMWPSVRKRCETTL